MLPANVYQLRWRVTMLDGGSFRGPWTPDTSSVKMTEGLIAAMSDKAQSVCIDGMDKSNGAKFPLYVIPVGHFKGMSYKAVVSASDLRTQIIGIDIQKHDGTVVSVLRNGKLGE